jgi:hypothetical protein
VFDEDFIRESVLNEVDALGVSVLPYRTKRSGNNDECSRLIWGFKNGERAAAELAVELLSEAISKHANLIQRLNLSLIACAPSSSAGYAKPICELVCERLAVRRSWLKHVPKVLRRTESIPSSHRSFRRTDRVTAAIWRR